MTQTPPHAGNVGQQEYLRTRKASAWSLAFGASVGVSLFAQYLIHHGCDHCGSAALS